MDKHLWLTETFEKRQNYMNSQLLIIGSLHKCDSKLKNQCVYCLFSRLPIAGHCQSMSSIIPSAMGTETFFHQSTKPNLENAQAI